MDIDGIRAAGRAVREPNWNDVRLGHDWRNHVLEDFRVLWPEMCDEARGAIYLTAVTYATAHQLRVERGGDV